MKELFEIELIKKDGYNITKVNTENKEEELNMCIYSNKHRDFLEFLLKKRYTQESFILELLPIKDNIMVMGLISWNINWNTDKYTMIQILENNIEIDVKLKYKSI